MGRWAIIELWNEWEIQILVLLSFTLQLVLLLLAGIRLRGSSTALRLLLWLAYQLADSTAIYALGHLSLSNAPRDHHLVAFWAPFLLLHLGGPDNITAYALEDNQLWQRHLLTLVVQVLGAAYVLYKHFGGSGIVPAAIVMLAAGTLKYGERTWALKCGNLGTIRSSLRKEPPARHYVYPEFNNVDLSRSSQMLGKADLHEEEELLLRRAHSVFHICQRAAVDSSVEVDEDSSDRKLLDYKWKTMWRLVEMQLSLLYDILYTKAAVVHTLPGYLIRIFTLAATFSSFLLFWFLGAADKNGGIVVDVYITYALLGGAFFMELTSLFGALTSSWTLTFLYATRWRWLQHEILCSGRWDWFRYKVLPLRRFFFGVRMSRRWSGRMGQYSILRFCSRSGVSELIGRLMQKLGFDEWWNKEHYTWKVDISEDLKKMLHKHLKDYTVYNDTVSTVGLIRKRWGKVALEKHEKLQQYCGVELMEGILMWHIGTHLFLIQRRTAKGGGETEPNNIETVRAIKAISNYMMFLLVNHPYMIPGLSLNMLYELTCQHMDRIWREHRDSTPRGRGHRGLLKRLFNLRDDDAYGEELAKVLMDMNNDDVKASFSHKNPRLPQAIQLAKLLVEIKDEDPLQLVLKMWLEILFYAANRCSGESHAKKLSSGAELTTFLWLMVHNHHNYLRTHHVAN